MTSVKIAYYISPYCTVKIRSVSTLATSGIGKVMSNVVSILALGEQEFTMQISELGKKCLNSLSDLLSVHLLLPFLLLLVFGTVVYKL